MKRAHRIAALLGRCRAILARRKRRPLIADQGWCAWLDDDPRSVRAMLRGRGDGRELLYEKFADYWREREPGISETTLHRRYAAYARHMDAKYPINHLIRPAPAPKRTVRIVLACANNPDDPGDVDILLIFKWWIALALVAAAALLGLLFN